MKKVLIILFSILWGTTVFAQTEFSKLQPPPFDSLTGKIKYSGDIQVLSVDYITSKGELFSRALSWFKYDFPSTMKFAVQVQDKEAGKIVAKALIHYSLGTTTDPYSLAYRQQQHEYWEYSISIMVRDGGYKYVLTDFNPLIEKIGSQIDDYGFPPNPDNHPIEGVDSLKLATWNNNFSFGAIAITSEGRIKSLKKAMANETPTDIKDK